MTPLQRLAQAVGLDAAWTDYRGERHEVTEETLLAVLAALGRPAATPADLQASLERVAQEQGRNPALITATASAPVKLRASARRGVLRLEGGGALDIEFIATAEGQLTFAAPALPGYHRLDLGERETTLAIAPERALTASDLSRGRRLWGAAAQVYSLNSGGGFGDFSDVARVAARLAGLGADALAISPVHALFTADPSRYAPYGPSTRLRLNSLYAPAPTVASEPIGDLVDWPLAAAAKLAGLDQDYTAFRASGDGRAAFEAFVLDGGRPLLDHARFEALDAHFRPLGRTDWRGWPLGYDDAASAAVQALVADSPEVEIHLFRQWRADQGLAAAQAAARAGGMAIGLVTDLAVGMDGAGSHAWSRPQDVLAGLSIGAPPDLLAPQGQDWGLTSFSPDALRREAYAPFLQTLRAALRHAGGVRIDHAIGLQRLWLTPQGGPPGAGAYLNYPLEDLLRLIALESHRHGAVVIGEDLGTVPEGFRARSTQAGLAGMRVLWFEQAGAHAFRPPGTWDRNAVALTTTHDLPTVAGWWRGRDLDWREALDLDPDPAASRQDRAIDKAALWDAMLASGAATGDPPDDEDAAVAVDAAAAHVGLSGCDLAIVPLEDLVGAIEQPNLPGTVDTHPNWRRRLPPGEGLEARQTLDRIARLAEARTAAP
jgi:4-alpha-glucanotransferase